MGDSTTTTYDLKDLEADHRELISLTSRKLDRYLFNHVTVKEVVTDSGCARLPEDQADPLKPIFYLTRREKSAQTAVVDLWQQLRVGFTPEQREIEIKLEDAYAESSTADEPRLFITGLLLGLRLAGISAADAEKMALTWKSFNVHDYTKDALADPEGSRF